MMKYMNWTGGNKVVGKLSLGLFLVATGIAGKADAATVSGSWQTIKEIYAQNNGLRVTLADSCSGEYQLSTTVSNYQVKASALLSAYYAGHEILPYYDNSVDPCSSTASMTVFKVRP